MRQHLVRVAHERRKELELEWGQRHGLAGHCHFALCEINGDQAVSVRPRLLSPVADAPKVGFHARQELLATEGLGHIVVRSRLQAAHLLQLGRPRGQHDHGNVAHVSNALERLPAVELGHRDVEEDEIWRRRVERTQALPAVGTLQDLVARPLEELANEATDIGVVVDDEHASSLHTRSIPDVAEIGRSLEGGEGADL